MKKFAGIILGALLTLGIATFAQAAPQSSDYNRFYSDLSPAQREEANKIFQDNYNQADALRQALNAKRSELDSVMNSQNPDMAKIESLSREIGELRGKLLANKIQVREQLKEKGLPSDMYGKHNAQRPDPYGQQIWDRRQGHGGHHHHGGHGYGRPYGSWGCPGMGMMGWW